MLYTKSTLAAALAVIPMAFAQTYTDCNPTEKSCANDAGFSGTSFKSDFTSSGANSSWSTAAYTTINYGKDGAEFTIAKAGQAPTIQTDFYIFFGKVEVVMQAAPGQGIVSSIVLESDDLDEIDWEFLGGDITQVETNYFGKGNTSTYDRAIYYPVSSPQTTFHTYTIDWKPESLEFIVDGAVVRTLNYADANGGSNYPQTPMRLKLGNWAGGAAGNAAGTIEWAGGATDFSQAPFTMYVKSVSVTNYNPATEYEWTDKTGSYKSIKVIGGDGSSASSGSSSGTSTTKSKSATNTIAPTLSHGVKAVQQTDAAVSSTASGAAPSTTVASLVSSHVASSSSAIKSGSAALTTLSSSVASSAKASSTKSSVSTSSGSSVSGSSSVATSSHTSSHSSSASSSATTSALSAEQTTNAAGSNGVARVMMVLGGIAVAFMTL